VLSEKKSNRTEQKRKEKKRKEKKRKEKECFPQLWTQDGADDDVEGPFALKVCDEVVAGRNVACAGLDRVGAWLPGAGPVAHHGGEDGDGRTEQGRRNRGSSPSGSLGAKRDGPRQYFRARTHDPTHNLRYTELGKGRPTSPARRLTSEAHRPHLHVDVVVIEGVFGVMFLDVTLPIALFFVLSFLFAF
jgi:hypothetical protein